MKCSECKSKDVKRSICCSDCRDKLLIKLNNIESMCKSPDPDILFLAYQLIKEEPFTKRVVHLYETERCGSAHVRTIKQLYGFIKQATLNYGDNAKRKLMEKHREFYSREAMVFLSFVKDHL